MFIFLLCNVAKTHLSNQLCITAFDAFLSRSIELQSLVKWSPLLDTLTFIISSEQILSSEQGGHMQKETDT